VTARDPCRAPPDRSSSAGHSATATVFLLHPSIRAIAPRHPHSCVHTRISASHSALGDAVAKDSHTTCSTVVWRASPLLSVAPSPSPRSFSPARHCFILYTTVRHACTLFHATGRPLTLATPHSCSWREACSWRSSRGGLGKNCWKMYAILLVDNSITLVQLQAQPQPPAPLSSHRLRSALRAARIGWAARK